MGVGVVVGVGVLVGSDVDVRVGGMEVLVGVRLGVLVEVALDVGMVMETAVGNGVAAGMQAITSNVVSTAKTGCANLWRL
jgi:hypothetical protein